MAGVADIGPLTLKELCWRAEAVRRERWDHTALLALCIARGPLKGRIKLADFHPFLDRLTPEEEMERLRFSAAALPEMLTEAEIAAGWEKVKDKIHG